MKDVKEVIRVRKDNKRETNLDVIKLQATELNRSGREADGHQLQRSQVWKGLHNSLRSVVEKIGEKARIVAPHLI
jgi:hypothetical protein